VVVSSPQPWLDAWRGASARAADALASPAAISAADWAESGAAALRRRPQLRYA
jgi:actin-related protein